MPEKTILADLRGYLIGHAKVYTWTAQRKFIQIYITEETPSSINLPLDIRLFDYAIANIIDNAVKYSFSPEERGKCGLQPKPASTSDKENVRITAKERKRDILIEVANMGFGIAENEKERIFERGYRSEVVLNDTDGTGIGLYLAKEIIQLHGGTLALGAETSPHNTLFEITLPKGAA